MRYTDQPLNARSLIGGWEIGLKLMSAKTYQIASFSPTRPGVRGFLVFLEDAKNTLCIGEWVSPPPTGPL